MTSAINPNDIDGTYPVAGQDNNSQGFRDNFTNTKTNFQYAANEITDLQNKVVLKAALTGTTLDNDMAGNPVRRWIDLYSHQVFGSDRRLEKLCHVAREVSPAKRHDLSCCGRRIKADIPDSPEMGCTGTRWLTVGSGSLRAHRALHI